MMLIELPQSKMGMFFSINRLLVSLLEPVMFLVVLELKVFREFKDLLEVFREFKVFKDLLVVD